MTDEVHIIKPFNCFLRLIYVNQNYFMYLVAFLNSVSQYSFLDIDSVNFKYIVLINTIIY